MSRGVREGLDCGTSKLSNMLGTQQEGPQRAAGLHQRSVQLNLVRLGSIVVAIHLLPEGLHIPVLCTSGGHNGGNKRQGKKC
jgi:hypothetical protein